MDTSNKTVGAAASPITSRARAAVDSELLNKWESIQNELKNKLILENTEPWQNDLSKLKLVAGLDISYPVEAHDKDSCDAFAAVVICDYPSMKIVKEKIETVRLESPYVPGFLAFRESDPLVSVLKKIIEDDPSLQPDVLLVDANGLLHPQRSGSACHIGYKTSIPTIGVAKNLHQLEGISCTRHDLQNMPNPGDYILIRDEENCILGMALKTAEKTKNPMYISIGHKINLETARDVVMSCCKFRVPEPVRFADNLSREAIRNLENPCQNTKKKSSRKPNSPKRDC